MKLSDFNFNLPDELIAQEPTSLRDHSDLLLPQNSGIKNSGINITKFYNLPNYLNEGDLLVFNNSKVINAKLLLHKGNAKININLNRPIGSNIWLGFVRPAKKIQEGDEFHLGDHSIKINKKLEFGEIEIEFYLKDISLFEFLDQYGTVPLPQYIKREELHEEDVQRYQNIYSDPKGSVAAATAGLHFSPELMQQMKEKNIETAFVTLHVGAGTFLPVKTENIGEHKMHSEWCEISTETAAKINKAKASGRRVISVGTTSMRTLESFAHEGRVKAGAKETNIFITPGYKFQIADILITNFHLPKSTLFMLVCAYAGYEEMKNIYKYAIDNKMRFFSYGDAMMIKKKDLIK